MGSSGVVNAFISGSVCLSCSVDLNKFQPYILHVFPSSITQNSMLTAIHEQQSYGFLKKKNSSNDFEEILWVTI